MELILSIGNSHRTRLIVIDRALEIDYIARKYLVRRKNKNTDSEGKCHYSQLTVTSHYSILNQNRAVVNPFGKLIQAYDRNLKNAAGPMKRIRQFRHVTDQISWIGYSITRRFQKTKYDHIP